MWQPRQILFQRGGRSFEARGIAATGEAALRAAPEMQTR